MKRFLRNIFREWLLPLGGALLVVVPLKSAVVDWNWVPTGSMKPTIMEGDLVLVNKLAYDLKIPLTTRHLATWAEPQRGDIAVFFSPADGDRLVKRVIGVPGDVVELKNDVLFLNGTAMSYRPAAGASFRRDVFEDANPVFAREHLGDKAHWVMALPHRSALRTCGPYQVPAGSYFMMGDSRDNSGDSRYFGPVERSRIVGRGSSVIVSFDLKRYLLPRFTRFFQPLDSSSL
jgi:signal peptidase I